MDDETLFGWIHISNVQFGWASATQGWDQQLVTDALRRDIAQKTVPVRVDAIFVTGDIAYSGAGLADDEYDRARKWLLDLSAAAGVSASRVFLVPGNHDVTRTIDSLSPATGRLLKDLRSRGVPQLEIDEALKNPEDRRLLAGRMDRYLKFAQSFGPWAGCSPMPPAVDRLYWVHEFATPMQKLRVRLLGFNTALLSRDDDDRGQLRLGKEQLAKCLAGNRTIDDLVIALSHHPLHKGWLGDEGDAETWIRRHAQIHLSDQAHGAESELACSGTGPQCVRLTAGASCDNRLPADTARTYTYNYNYGQIRSDRGKIYLRAYPRQWSGSKAAFVLDVHRVPGPADGQQPMYTEHALEITARLPIKTAASSHNIPASRSGPHALEEREAHFRDAVTRRYSRHQIRLPSFASTNLPLDDIYVDLRVVADTPESDTFSAEERRIYAELPDATGLERVEKLRQLDDLRYRRRRRPDSVPADLLVSALDRVTYSPRPLVILGDPGSGKSTALRLMALQAARMGRLRAQDNTPEHGPWLPILVPLASYDEKLRIHKDLRLEDFLSEAWREWTDNADLHTLFASALRAGRALVLLDGLDEVLDRARRGHVNNQVTALFGTWAPRGNRFVVTCRFVGYREASLSEVDVVSVVDFGLKDIERFLARWYEATDPEGGARRQKVLLNQIKQAPRLRDLAANPLMLSMLATLHSRRAEGERLPDRRIELYREFTEMMLDLHPDTRSDGARTDSIPRTVNPTTMRARLADLALWLQQNRPSNTASREDVEAALKRSYLRYQYGDATQPHPRENLEAVHESKSLLEELRKTEGILGERGHDAYGFLHLTYQEFFAAGAIAEMPPDERWNVLEANLHNPRWREVILLCAGYLDTAGADDLTNRTLHTGSEHENILHRDLLLTSNMVAGDARVSSKTLIDIHDALATLLDDAIPTVRTHALGAIVELARLGVERSITMLADLLRGYSSQSRPPLNAIYGLVAPLLTVSSCRSLRDFVLQRACEGAERDPETSAALHALHQLVQTDESARSRVLSKLATAPYFHIDTLLGSLIDEHPDVESAFWALTKDARYQQPAIFSIAQHCSSEPTLRRLLDAFWSDRSHRTIRQALLPALAKLARQDRRWLDELVGCVEDQDHNTKTQSISHLGTIARNNTDALTELIALVGRIDIATLPVVVGALAPFAKTDPQARLTVTRLMSSSAPELRRAAISGLSSAASNVDVREVLSTHTSDPDYSVREIATRALMPFTAQVVSPDTILERLNSTRSEANGAYRVDTVAPLIDMNDGVLGDIEALLDGSDPELVGAALKTLASSITSDANLRERVLRRRDRLTALNRSAVVSALVGAAPIDDNVRSFVLAVATSDEDWAAKLATDALGPMVHDPTVRTALFKILQHQDAAGRRVASRSSAARSLACLVPDDVEISNWFQGLCAEMVAGRTDPYEIWSVVELLEGVVARDATILKDLLSSVDKSFPALVLIIRHAAALSIDVDHVLNSTTFDNFHTSRAVVRGMLPRYRSSRAVRDYVLRNFDDCAAIPEGRERLIPLSAEDDALRGAFIRRASAWDDNTRSGVDALECLIAYAKVSPDVRQLFRTILDRQASGHFQTLRQMLAAAGLSSIAEGDRALQERFLPWLGARIPDPAAQMARRVLAESFGAFLTLEDTWLRARIVSMLDSDAWQDRQGAAWSLIRARGEIPASLLNRLRNLLHDTRTEESWKERLSVAEVVLNHKSPHVSRKAMAVACEALEYGKDPWYGPLGNEVRQQAAGVLGKLEPMYRNSSLIEQIIAALKEDPAEEVRNALYHALLQLVTAGEPAARPSS